MKKTLAIIAAAASMSSAHAAGVCVEGPITNLGVYLDDSAWGPSARKTFRVVINGGEFYSRDPLTNEAVRAMFTMALSAQSVGQSVYLGGDCSDPNHLFTTLGITLKTSNK